jgi:hypothetical protein
LLLLQDTQGKYTMDDDLSKDEKCPDACTHGYCEEGWVRIRNKELRGIFIDFVLDISRAGMLKDKITLSQPLEIIDKFIKERFK